MKAILKYTLPEEEQDFLNAVNGRDWQVVLWDLDQWLRGESKYKNRESIPVDELRDKIRELMDEIGLTFAT